MKGKLITVSGIDGVGKSTLIESISDRLKVQGIDHITCSEPHPRLYMSATIRQIIKSTELPSNIVIGLVTSARAEVCEKIINPGLKEGKIIISHRFLLDSMAYHDRKIALEAHKLLCDNIKPDCQIILDADIDICKQRIKQRNNPDEIDVFDNADDSVLEERRQGFLWHLFTENTHVVDATTKESTVFENTWDIVLPVIEQLFEHNKL